MPRSLAAQLHGTEQQSLPTPSGTSVKATLHPKVSERSLRALSLPAIAKDVIQERINQGAAAKTIAISEGRMSAKLTDGSLTLAQLDKLGDDVVVPLAEEILERRGKQYSPAHVMREEIRNIRRALDIVEQGIDWLTD